MSLYFVSVRFPDVPSYLYCFALLLSMNSNSALLYSCMCIYQEANLLAPFDRVLTVVFYTQADLLLSDSRLIL